MFKFKRFKTTDSLETVPNQTKVFLDMKFSQNDRRQPAPSFITISSQSWIHIFGGGGGGKSWKPQYIDKTLRECSLRDKNGDKIRQI